MKILVPIIISTIVFTSIHLSLKITSIEELSSTPLSSENSKPQGIVMLNDASFLLSVHHNDTKSTIYQVNKIDQQIMSEFDMPPDATHTSGITIVDSTLIAVDYNSNKIYFIDLYKSLNEKKVKLESAINTDLGGTSAITSFTWNQTKYIAVSDFLNSRKTYILDYNELLENQNFSKSKISQYNNGWFSQGIAFNDGYIFESRNSTFGNGYIECRRIEDILNGNQVKVSKVRTSLKGIEDIDYDGTHWWTTDELTFRYYKMEIEND